MKQKPKVTDHHHVERVKYDPLTGIFTHGGAVLSPCWSGGCAPLIVVPGKTRLRFPAARLAWALHNKRVPPPGHYVLFVDEDNTNLKISNLVCVSRSAARHRQKTPAHNTSGHRNVSWVPTLSKWRVKVSAKGVNRFVGLFEDITEAVAAAAKARRELHGDFAATV